MFDRRATNDLPHHWITTKTVGVVDILPSGKT